MPFSIDLKKTQHTKQWTFKRTDAALELQSLLNKGNRQGYIQLLRKLNDSRKFTRSHGLVYELFDEEETIDVSIKFQVKKSVITWSFIAPFDRTHQSFRDEVFNTAAKAHACVANSCETYYRGTDHFHLKEMHSYAEEAFFNHNHYRTANGGPITPVEVYEHLFGFYAQQEGRKFIPTARERDDIILKFAVYWANFNADIQYVAFSLLKNEGGYEQVLRQLKEIATIGKLTPDQADKLIEDFFNSEHGKNMLKLAETQGFPPINDVMQFIKGNYRAMFHQYAPVIEQELAANQAIESQSVSSIYSTPTSSRKSSPRDDYMAGPDQAFDEIDRLEFETFATDLTKHCQSVNKELLQDLDLVEFRKGLMLYFALNTTQKAQMAHHTIGDVRFHKDFLTNELIQQMLEELPSLQHGATQPDIPGKDLLSKLVIWVKEAPPELERWVTWVSVNGSRGLGAEIGGVRSKNGHVDLKQAIPMQDRNPSDNLAQINFEKVNLADVFLPYSTKAEKATPVVNADAEVLIHQLNTLLQDTIKQRLSSQSQQPNDVFRSKVQMIELALAVIKEKESLETLIKTSESSAEWKSASAGLQSKLEKLVQEVIEIKSGIVSQNSALNNRL